MRKKSAAIMGLALLSTVRIAVGDSQYGHDHGPDPFEPTVTRAESTLLNDAMAVATTNNPLALRMLETERSRTASPALDFAVGNLHFQDERLDDAATAYRAALKKLPRFRSAIMNLGRVYLIQERTHDAIELYQGLVTDGQADADILLLLGHALLLEDAPVSAEGAYRQSLLLQPKHSDAMLGLAKALMQQERYAEGLALVGEILAGDPANRELWSLRANAYLSMGSHAEAARAIEKARRLGCADREMLATLGDLLLNRDQPEDALHAYERAFTEGEPSVPRLLRAIEGFLMVADETRAEAMIQRAEAILRKTSQQLDSEARIRLLRLKAEHAQLSGASEKAIRLCEEVLALDPLDGHTMLVLARLQQEGGQLEDAVMTCERAARVPGHEAEALVRQAQIEVARQRYDRAVPLLEAAQTFRDQPHVARYLDQVRRMVQ
jgi:tetratricopeptide (TPR) repeat protein